MCACVCVAMWERILEFFSDYYYFLCVRIQLFMHLLNEKNRRSTAQPTTVNQPTTSVRSGGHFFHLTTDFSPQPPSLTHWKEPVRTSASGCGPVGKWVCVGEWCVVEVRKWFEWSASSFRSNTSGLVGCLFVCLFVCCCAVVALTLTDCSSSLVAVVVVVS